MSTPAPAPAPAPRRTPETSVMVLWAVVRRRWNVAVVVATAIGWAVPLLACVAFRDDWRWALIAFLLALWVAVACNSSVVVLRRSDRRALRTVIWYLTEVETDVDRALDAGEVASARVLALARSDPATALQRFQECRLRDRLAAAGVPVGEAAVGLGASVAALSAADAKDAAAALAVLAAQRSSARGEPWLGHLADADPDLRHYLARRRPQERRRRIALVIGVAGTAAVLSAAALLWPPPPPRLASHPAPRPALAQSRPGADEPAGQAWGSGGGAAGEARGEALRLPNMVRGAA